MTLSCRGGNGKSACNSGAGKRIRDAAGAAARLSLPSLGIDLPLTVAYENVALEKSVAGLR